MDTKTLKKIEMKNDDHDQERFQQILKKVVNVPKDEIKKREEELKAAKRIKSAQD